MYLAGISITLAAIDPTMIALLASVIVSALASLGSVITALLNHFYDIVRDRGRTRLRRKPPRSIG